MFGDRVIDATALEAMAAGERRSAIIVETAEKRGVLGWIPPGFRPATFTVDQTERDTVCIRLVFQPTSEVPMPDESPRLLAGLERLDNAKNDLFVWIYGAGAVQWAIVIPGELGPCFKVTSFDGENGSKVIGLLFRVGGKGLQ